MFKSDTLSDLPCTTVSNGGSTPFSRPATGASIKSNIRTNTSSGRQTAAPIIKHAATPPTLHAATPPTLHAATPPTLHAATPPTLHAYTPTTLHAATPPTLHAATPPLAVQSFVARRREVIEPPAWTESLQKKRENIMLKPKTKCRGCS